MISNGKKNILGIYVNAIDYDAVVGEILSAAKTKKSLAVSALAVHGIMMGVLDPVHRYRLNHLDFIVPDGQPVRWALNWLYHTHLKDRVYGPTLVLKVCEQAAQQGLPIYLYGSTPYVIKALSLALRTCFPDLVVAGAEPSRFRQISVEEKKKIIQKIQRSGAVITFVGLGCPRQEVWVYEYRDALSMPLIAVGAAFDFHAGRLSRAPLVMQRIGLEWLYRLLCEPKRLWKRYVLLNPLYIWFLLLQAMGIRKFDPSKATPPGCEMRYA